MAALPAEVGDSGLKPPQILYAEVIAMDCVRAPAGPRIGSINHLCIGSQQIISPDRPVQQPSAGHVGSPISVQIGVTPPSSFQRLPCRRAFPLPACFPANRRHDRAAAAALGTTVAAGLRALTLSHPSGRGSSRLLADSVRRCPLAAKQPGRWLWHRRSDRL